MNRIKWYNVDDLDIECSDRQREIIVENYDPIWKHSRMMLGINIDQKDRVYLLNDMEIIQIGHVIKDMTRSEYNEMVNHSKSGTSGMNKIETPLV